MVELKKLMKQRKFWILISIEVFIILMFTYLFWFDILKGSSEYTPPLIACIGGILGLLANGLPPLFYSKEMAEMYNKTSWGLYRFGPRGAKRLGIFIVSVCIVWFGYLVYDNHGIINLWRIVWAAVK